MGDVPNYLNEELPFLERAKDLVSKMTLEEKAMQTVYHAPAIPRLNIKSYNWWNEALHGVARAGTATVFPQAIALAATFDEDFAETVADAVSTEGRAKFNMCQEKGDHDIYKGLTFWTPNINIFRDQRWGRGHETYGEDPYLTTRLGIRFVNGLQGKHERYLKTAACAKHYAVHSGPEDVRHSFDAIVSKKDLYETYLPAFEALVKEAKVESVMGAYNRVNGEPCCGSKTLLVDILRGEWNFEGHVVSDCWAIKDFHDGHLVTDTPVESAAMAINNGCDLNCGNMYLLLMKAYDEGLVTEEEIDTAVTRLMVTRMKLGMFDAPERVPFNEIPYSVVDSKEHKELNLLAAKKSVVLLKNSEKLLPLDKSKIKTIGVIGPNADNRKALIGNYEGTASEYVTVLEGIRNYVGDDTRIYYSEGCHLYKDKMSSLSQPKDRHAEAVKTAEMSDVVIMCLGLDPGLEGEEGDQGNEFASGDKHNLNLPGMQEDLLKAVCATGKPVILVLMSGSALAVNWADENVGAILQCFYPGAQGGNAIADILFGGFSPEGKLPVTFVRTTEELPDFTDYAMAGRTYRYMKNSALYPFGYGLSYTTFEATGLQVCGNKFEKDDKININITVKNTGSVAGSETAQLYIKSHCGDADAPNWQLKGLKKLALNPTEEGKAEFTLSAQDFALCDVNGNRTIGVGEYEIFVGLSQPDERSIELRGQNVASVKCRFDGSSFIFD